MNFISWAFVLLLIPVLAARFAFGRRHTEPAFLAVILLASTIFVCWYIPIYILVLLVSLTVDYIAALLIDAGRARKFILAASLTTNLALLGFFKYANFFTAQVSRLSVVLHTPTISVHHLNIALPIGISFYTFGSMSYTIDVYRGKIKPVRSFADFYFFLTFFPHMVAGPIIRAEQFFYQMRRRRRPSLRVFNQGGYQIIRGLLLKMVCADNLAPVVNQHWAQGYAACSPSTSSLVLALLFAAQIFCDFEGYCSIARGLAYWLGFRFPINFNNPYLANSFSNFWERWHITLSRWLRDYLYIPLGGNRISRPRTCLNLMIVLILGGLWHGAAMTFIAWGALHGAALVVERFIGLHRIRQSRARRWIWYMLVQATVLIGWTIFRSDSLHDAGHFLVNALRFTPGAVDRSILWACVFAAPIFLMHLHGHLVESQLLPPLSRHTQAMLAAVMLFTVLANYGPNSAFIYFQF